MEIQNFIIMIEQLYDYLINNGNNADANRINEVKKSLQEDGVEKKQQLKRLIAMCSVKYLGDTNIKEFENPYDWLNFLGNISEQAKKVLADLYLETT